MGSVSIDPGASVSVKKGTGDDLPLLVMKAAILAVNVLGVAAIVCYCMSIGYFPQGLSISDTLVLVFLAIGYGFFLGIMFLMCYVASWPVTSLLQIARRGILWALAKCSFSWRVRIRRLLRFRAPLPVSKTVPVMLVLVLCLIWLLGWKKFSQIHVFWSDVVAFASLGGIAIFLWKNLVNLPSVSVLPAKYRVVSVVGAMLISAFLVMESKGDLSINAFAMVNLRRDRVSIELDEEYREFAKRVLAEGKTIGDPNGFSIRFPNELQCKSAKGESPFSKDNGGLIKANILFGGVGANYVVEIGGCNFIVPNDKIKVSY